MRQAPTLSHPARAPSQPQKKVGLIVATGRVAQLCKSCGYLRHRIALHRIARSIGGKRGGNSEIGSRPCSLILRARDTTIDLTYYSTLMLAQQCLEAPVSPSCVKAYILTRRASHSAPPATVAQTCMSRSVAQSMTLQPCARAHLAAVVVRLGPCLG
ncbi:hypothetical protein BCV70DRAFT_65506 [Testicularia cyperi]|uniref:Uncharacterized protein n=1 Tax=Testicularia cyperi TaxID=1882483 RepID=A0A317XH60_9BASI|nr:hypothetical protein BCV70DRAFT_65506 [Testicularia cyperi]